MSERPAAAGQPTEAPQQPRGLAGRRRRLANRATETGTWRGEAVGGVLGGLLRTTRPRQWIKNALVFAAPGAAGQLGQAAVLLRLALVFALFTCAAGAVYLVNDAFDVEADRAHPDKCQRPVASGQVPMAVAFTVGILLAVLAPITAALATNPATACAVAAYVVLQMLYCVCLKHVLVVDLTMVTSGFLLRAMAGGLAVGVPLSRWFLITAGFGALFMVSAKRYSELVLMDGRSGSSRALLTAYTGSYLRFVWQLAAGAAVLSYCLWAVEVPLRTSGLLPWRQLSIIPFVLLVLRYAVFADRGRAEAPEELALRDRPLVAATVVWAVLYALAVVGW